MGQETLEHRLKNLEEQNVEAGSKTISKGDFGVDHRATLDIEDK